jgi:hypothetical protein
MLWYDSSKADIGKQLIAAVDGNCNAYVNYEAYAGSPTLHSIIKKYSDVQQAPASITKQNVEPLTVNYNYNTIEISTAANKIENYVVVDALGKKITDVEKINNTIRLHTAALSNGIYIAVVQTSKGNYSQKIIVQH